MKSMDFGRVVTKQELDRKRKEGWILIDVNGAKKP